MLSQVQSQARIIALPRDPPGQESHYINPGDPGDENYRLTTFGKFPFKPGMNIKQLVQNGFLYTGYRDRIKCCSCGQAVENWTHSEVPESIKPSWHNRDCEFANKSYNQYHSKAAFAGPPRKMQKQMSAGQLLLASVPPTQRGTDMVRTPGGLITTQRPLTPTQQAHERQEARRLAETYPCRNPKNPAMADERSRKATFREKWPYHIHATPGDMAEAGLYFVAARDRVKCWYCGCGLYNWELNDDPWVEHAKQSPRCEFVLRNKGEKFVKKCLELWKGKDVCGPNFEEACKREEARLKVENEMRNSMAVESMRRMGFSDKVIRKALYWAHEAKQDVMSSERLLDACIKHGETESTTESHESNRVAPSTTTQSHEMTPKRTSINHMTAEECEHEVQRLKYDRQCKVCLLNPASVVLAPCMHLACCSDCTGSTPKCPICKEEVESRLPTASC